MRTSRKSLGVLVSLIVLQSLSLWAQPGTYFDGISTSSATFVTDLQNLINPHTRITYDNYDETNIANFASRDTTNGQKVVTCVYSGLNYVYTPPFKWWGNAGVNNDSGFSREHSWCQSWMPSAHASNFTSLPEYSDQHHLFPVNQVHANDPRSNHPEGVVVSPTYTFLACKVGTDASGHTVFEPRQSHKGDFARALFYMAVCYNGVNGYDWTFNHLNNVILDSLSEAAQDVNLLLQWNKDDPPDAWEVSRNNYIQSIQNNRNPFVDHPEWANYINFNDLSKLTPTYAVEPSNHVTNLAIGNVTSSSLTVSWTNAAAGSQQPSGYLIELYASDDYFTPEDGSVYADDTDLTDNRAVVNVANSGGTSHQFTGLSCGTTYYVHMYSYNGSSSQINYKIDGTVPSCSATTGSATLAAEPSKYPGGFNLTTPTITNSSITIRWIDSAGGTVPSGYLILANTTNAFSDPVDGVTYSNDTNLGDGSAVVNVPYGSGDSLQCTGLLSLTSYSFRIYPYNGSGCQRNYKTDNFPSSKDQVTYTTGAASSSPTVVVNEYFNASAQSGEWVELLVIQNNLDMRGMQLRDYSSAGNAQTPVVFSNAALWSSVPKGTFIVLLGKGNAQAQDFDISDKKLVVSDTNATYFTGGASGFDISGTADALEILTSGGGHIHSLSHGSKPGSIASLAAPTANSTTAPASGHVVQFVNIGSVSDFGLDSKTSAGGAGTEGSANDAAESSFVATNLPVELSSFTARAAEDGVELRWTTATETENYGFEVERSTMNNEQSTMNSWETIGFVHGYGTSSSVHRYSFKDASAVVGSYNYRLKQIDRNGNFEYSDEVEATMTLAPNTILLGQNYPNPFNPETSIEFAVPTSGIATLKVYNTLGEEVATLVNGSVEAGVLNRAAFNGASFAGGAYFYTLRSGRFIETRKMLLLK
ncbi:MAG TPA: endonuclease [Bacteroidota bacterium]|nr:endonuclease [Bacteroidota bacterium]